MEPLFEAEALFKEAMEHLRKIAHTCLIIDILAAAATAGDLAEALGRLDLSDPLEHPALMRFTVSKDKEVVNVSMTSIDPGVVETLVKVTDGTVDPESLIKKSTPVELPLDPASIRRQLTLDSRGTRLLAAWQAAGGDTPAYMAVVHQMVGEDGGIEPMVRSLSYLNDPSLHDRRCDRRFAGESDRRLP
ncbi:MAG: hypothetical protein WA724_09750 [Candidatus Dormiibacterota bacterium]